MNEKEKKDFYVAMCRCCLIAEAMKTCAVCRFSIGLAERVSPVEFDAIPVSISTKQAEPMVVRFEFAQAPSI
jgi:hypothetical protein